MNNRNEELKMLNGGVRHSIIRLFDYSIILALSLVLGCGREEAVAEKGPEVVTNVVEVMREVVVTNVMTVTETVTNVVVERREPERILSSRKTAPYLVAAKAFDAAQLRKLASDSAARVIECQEGAVAVVEATDRAARLLSAAVTVVPLGVAEKVPADVGEDVRIFPVSTIDATAVVAAVRAQGGEVVQVITVGTPVVRAKMDLRSIRKLAERGDVRRIERDEK